MYQIFLIVFTSEIINFIHIVFLTEVNTNYKLCILQDVERDRTAVPNQRKIAGTTKKWFLQIEKEE